MTINDNVSFDKISNTDINGRCIPPFIDANFSTIIIIIAKALILALVITAVYRDKGLLTSI